MKLSDKQWIYYINEDVRIVFRPWGLHKFLLTGFGYLFLGWWGIPIGFVLGCLLDTRHETKAVPPKPGDLGMSFMMLGMAIIKADGRADRSSIHYAYRYLAGQFGMAYVRTRQQVFEGFLLQTIPTEEICEQLDYHLDYPAKLQLMYFLSGIASADGLVSRDELEMISRIADMLHVEVADFKSMLAMWRSPSENAYEVLEITSDASDQEVRQAYLRLAKVHHPDKVAHLGEEYLHSAKEKFQKILDAYENIREARGI
jgi:DnaJ like chaperone protein